MGGTTERDGMDFRLPNARRSDRSQQPSPPSPHSGQYSRHIRFTPCPLAFSRQHQPVVLHPLSQSPRITMFDYKCVPEPLSIVLNMLVDPFLSPKSQEQNVYSVPTLLTRTS